jgi:hypothetical protein
MGFMLKEYRVENTVTVYKHTALLSRWFENNTQTIQVFYMSLFYSFVNNGYQQVFLKPDLATYNFVQYKLSTLIFYSLLLLILIMISILMNYF